MMNRGFLSRVVADVDLSALAQATLHRISQLAPQAARLNKQTLRVLNPTLAPVNKAQSAIKNELFETPLEQLMATAYDYATSHEQREGIVAFLEKRPAKF
jgi:enoyl-CoA hydratase/carnithine racemase